MEIVPLLLPLVCCEYQEIQLVNELTDYFYFDHHIFLLDSSADTNRHLNTQGHTPQSLFVFESADNVTGLANVKENSSKNQFLIVVPEIDQLEQNSSLLRQIKRIQRLQINMKVGVFLSQNASMDDLHKFFEWCKDNLIVDIFVAINPCSPRSCSKCSIKLFTFEPFGRFDVKNVTDRETYDGFFPSQNSNFQQHHLQLGQFMFEWGYGLAWRTVFHLMNASYVLVNRSGVSGNELDLDPTLMAGVETKPVRVYPLEVASLNVIVPEALPHSEFSAYLRNVTSGAFCLCLFIAIVALVLVLSILRYVEQKKIVFFQSTADVFNLLMNDNFHIKYHRLSRSELFVVVPLTFVGLIFTNGILSALKSYVTQPLLQPQLKTLEDIYASSFPIAAYGEAWRIEAIKELTRRTVDKDWSTKVYYENNYYDHITNYNRTMSYLMDEVDVKVIFKIQKLLKIKGFHNPHIQIASLRYSYRENDKFLYFDRLNEIMHRINSGGLLDLWIRQYFADIENDIIKRNVNNRKEAHVESFEFPTFIIYGWLAGLLFFILELIWKRFNFSKIKKIRQILPHSDEFYEEKMSFI